MKKKNSIAFHIGQRIIGDSIYFIRRFGHLWDSVFDHVISTERYSIGWIKLMIWYGHQDLVLWENGNKHNWKKTCLLLGTTDFFHIKINTWQHFSDGQSVLTKYLDIRTFHFGRPKTIPNGFSDGRADRQNQNFYIRVRCHLYDNSVNGFDISHFSEKKIKQNLWK